MNLFRNGIDAGGEQANTSINNPSSHYGKAAKASAAEAMEFQLWVSEQSHSLSKIKLFHTMAKSINDQQ